MSGVHQVSADSGLAPVLSLEPLCKMPRAYQSQLLPALGPQTAESCPRKTAAQAGAGYLPPKVSLVVIKQKPADCCSKSLLPCRGGGVGETGLVAQTPKVPPATRVEWSHVPGSHQSGVSGVYQASTDSDLAVLREGLNTGKMALACKLCRRRAQHGDNGGCFPALTLKPYYSVFSYMSLVLFESLLLRESPRWSAYE